MKFEFEVENKSQISDGYHTFEELYYHRMILFSIILKQNKQLSWKSKLHNDGTMFDNYFICGINTPQGQYTYHYDMKYWDRFDGIKELEKAPEWDGHLPEDITRLVWEEKKNHTESSEVKYFSPSPIGCISSMKCSQCKCEMTVDNLALYGCDDNNHIKVLICVKCNENNKFIGKR